MMKSLSPLTCKIVAHKAVPNFNYDDAVDWAVEMIGLGHDTENLLILAGLSKPVNYFEAIKYLNSAVTELGLQFKVGNEGIISYSSYCVMQIANGTNVKENLAVVCKYAIDLGCESSFDDFCSLNWAWEDLDWPDNNGIQWYWDGATIDNIEQIAIDTAKQWLIDNGIVVD